MFTITNAERRHPKVRSRSQKTTDLMLRYGITRLLCLTGSLRLLPRGPTERKIARSSIKGLLLQAKRSSPMKRFAIKLRKRIERYWQSRWKVMDSAQPFGKVLPSTAIL